MIKKFISALIVGIMAFSFVACGDSQPTKDESKSTQKQEEQKKEEPKQTEFKIGDAVKLNGMILTVTGKQISQGDQIAKPKEGNDFVIVNVKIENKGDKTISYNPVYFKLQNSNGQITDVTFMPIDGVKELEMGDLVKDGHVEGALVFEAPKGDNGLKLLFQDNIFTKDSKITIDLQ